MRKDLKVVVDSEAEEEEEDLTDAEAEEDVTTDEAEEDTEVVGIETNPFHKNAAE